MTLEPTCDAVYDLVDRWAMLFVGESQSRGDGDRAGRDPVPRLGNSTQSMALQCCPYLAEQRIMLRAPVREVIVPIRSPRCDHREHEDPAVAKQEWIRECVVIANLVGCVGDVEFRLARSNTSRGQ